MLALARLLFLPLASAAPFGYWEHARLHTLEDDDDLSKDASDPDLWIYLGIAVALVLLGGIFAGLTIALMGQDETYLQVIASSGDGSEKKHAKKVLNLLNKGKHWVLVTLLLSNVITNETLPIVLDRSLGGGWPAVVSSTVLIVIFGEIAPQSVCVRYGLSIGALMAPFVLFLMWALAPVAWPTAKLLDWLLGEDHGTMYKKAGLKTLVTLHKTLGESAGERLMEDEVTIINSVLDLKEKPVGDIMTPMQDVFTMSADTILDERMMDTILSQGYSRIPIYMPDNPRNFIGMLLVKILITYDPEDAKRVRDFALATLPETAPNTSCLDIINFFQEGKSHMVLVSDYPGQDKGALGVVTLEDVIEELIGEEIIDESDVFVDVHKAIRRMAPAPKSRWGSKQFDYNVMEETDDEHKEATETAPLLNRKESGDGQGATRTRLANGQATFLMRRKSSAASESTRAQSNSRSAMAVKSNANDLKEHLRHLGPSNAASHPRSTKVTSVKIKPGVGTIPENQATTTGVDETDRSRPFPSASRTRDETPKGGVNPSGGTAAVYGTMGTPVQRARKMSGDKMSASEASRIASENTGAANAESKKDDRNGTEDTGEPEPLQLPDKMVVGDAGEAEDEDDAVGEMTNSVSTGKSKKRAAARSGSITETTVDMGGFKKIVLETTSSSSEEDGVSPSDSTRRSPWFGGSSKNEDEEGKGQEAAQANGEGKKRRKKRGKKKKGGD